MGKVRSRKISLVEFRRLVSAERRVAKSYGFDVKLRYKPFSWNRVKQHGVHTNVSGSFDQELRCIVLIITGRPSRTWIMAVLYHEMRHLEHYTDVMFKDYYRLSPAEIHAVQRDDVVPKGFMAPCMRTALLAERDCDRISHKRLRGLGLKHNIGSYPAHRTLSFSIIATMLAILIRKLKTDPNSQDTIDLISQMRSVVERAEQQLNKLKNYRGSNWASYAEIQVMVNHIKGALENKEMSDG